MTVKAPDVVIPSDVLRSLLLDANHADYVTAASSSRQDRAEAREAIRAASTAYFNVTGEDLERAAPAHWRGSLRPDRRRKTLGLRRG